MPAPFQLIWARFARGAFTPFSRIAGRSVTPFSVVTGGAVGAVISFAQRLRRTRRRYYLCIYLTINEFGYFAINPFALRLPVAVTVTTPISVAISVAPATTAGPLATLFGMLIRATFALTVCWVCLFFH